jgi:pimeloyl-ACP methyl ester carboxylesterase
MSARYGDIRVPTAIISGETDRTVSPKIHSTRLAGDIPGATLELIPDTGHALHHSQSQRILAAIENLARAASAN